MTYPETRTYWLEPTNRVAVGLRRYAREPGTTTGTACHRGYHAALVFTGEATAVFDQRNGNRVLEPQPATPADDPRWPVTCGCGYEFTDDDPRQDWQELIYRRTDTRQLFTLRERQPDDIGGPTPAPPGASWDAWWMPFGKRGTDGIHLMVRCPNGRDWHVDGRASNCTMPDEHEHRCWVRHGDPRMAEVTVDKNGATCGAGGGSIQAGDYHGFLQAGVLTAG